jgi:hypothetical protein
MQQKRPASHTSALGELFIADERAGAQGEVLGVTVFTEMVRETSEDEPLVSGQG